jgi:hypothetical protein
LRSLRRIRRVTWCGRKLGRRRARRDQEEDHPTPLDLSPPATLSLLFPVLFLADDNNGLEEWGRTDLDTRVAVVRGHEHWRRRWHEQQHQAGWCMNNARSDITARSSMWWLRMSSRRSLHPSWRLGQPPPTRSMIARYSTIEKVIDYSLQFSVTSS